MRAKGMYRLIAGLLCMMIVLSENSIYTLASTAPVADAIDVFAEPETQEETTESQNSEIVETSSAEIETVSSEVEETEGLEETTTIEETSTVQQELETMEEEESSQEAITSVEEVIEPETFGEEDYEEAMKVYGEFMDIMATSGEEYNLTEEQLFLQCPQYLKTNAVDTYLSRCVGYTVDAMNDVSGTEEVIASLLYALENGTAFLTQEIAALCGITDSTYSDFKKEMAMELVREYVGTEAYLKDLAEDVSKNFSIVDNFYGKEVALVKAEYITQLKKASVKMSDSDIEKTVNKLFEKSDTLMKYAGAGITVFDMITAIIEVQELEITLVDELMICLEDSYDTDLYEGLVMIRNDITDDVVTYIIQNYVVDDAIKYISGMVTGIANANISTGLAIAKIAVTVISGFYEGFKPSVSNIINTTVMYNYYNTLEASVYSYQKDFYKKQATTDDIKYFRAAYKGHLCAIKLMMKYAKGLTGNQRLKNQLEIYGESIGKEVTCDTYIKLCLRDASAAIDAGTLVLEESGSVDKTEDGTVMDESYDSTESITARLNVIMQKYVPDVNQTWKDNWGGAIQCFGFVRMVFYKLYGCDMPASYYGGKRYEYTNEKNVTLIGQVEGSEVTASNIKNMFAQGHVGDVIQGHGAPYGQHTMMLLGVTDTGIRTYECNLNGECGIYTRTYTWEKLASRYGTGDSNSGNGLSLYHANNYEKIYGNGDDLFYDDGVNFVIQDGVLTKYNGWQSFVTIPEGVTAIGANAFKNNTNMMTVDIPETVTSIGDYAFSGCSNLLGIVIPDSVKTIGNSVFANCRKLARVSLSKKVTEIGYYAFQNCVALTSIEIPRSLQKTTSEYLPSGYAYGIFVGCTNLKNVTFEKGTTKIANYLLARCSGLEKIEIPDTITEIGYEAFYSCENLKEVKISESVTKIGNASFERCSNLKEIEIPDSVIIIGNTAFANCGKLEKVSLSKKVTEIGYYAFQNCVALTSIEIPRSLQKTTSEYLPSGYAYGIFVGCTNLKNVTFEEGTTKIVNYLFARCSGLEKIEIPNTVTEIGYNAFYSCSNLKSITLPEGLKTLGDSVFYNCTSLEEVNIPDTVDSMGTYTFYNCTSLQKVHLPKIRVNVGEATFYNCSNLTEVNFPETLNYIRKNAFRGTKISEAILPQNIMGIEDYAFYNCDALTKVSIPDKTTSIGSYCFADCELLSDVKLGNGLTVIPTYAFNLCPSLESIVLPYRVTTINNNAFTNCTGLTEITIPRSVTSIGSSVFSYPSKLTIYGISRTYAETYAEQIGATFVNKEVKATEVKFLSDALTMNKGAKSRMVIVVTPENFTDEIIWRTADTDIISVDDDGVVTAKALGTAKVQVVVGDVSATRTITVRRPVSSISLNKTALSLDALQTSQLKATVYPSDASVKTVKWSSSNEAVATVDQTGKVTALTKGQATITVAAQDGSGVSNTCTVNVLNICYVCESPLDMESAHNYESNCTDSWIYTEEGAKQLFVSFDDRTEIEDDFDFLYIYDKNGKQVGKYTGTSLAGEMVKITGDTVRIKLVTDKVGTKWGFKVTRISQTDELDPIITTTTRPYANIASGSYVLTGTEIILSCKDEGAQIYYTIDGSEPLLTSSIYNNPIIIQQDTVIKAIADKEGLDESPTVVYEYYIADSEDTADTVPAGDIPEDGIPDGLWIAGLKDCVYTGKAIKPEVRVYDGSHRLTEGRDYTIKYKNNTKANDASVAKKAPTITVKGKGNYTGTVSETFKILPVDLESKEIMVEELLTAYTGKVQKKVPILKYNGKKLVNKKDFMVSYPAPEGNENGAFKDVGTYEIVVTAKEKGNYTGSTKVKLTITERILMSKVSVKKIPNQLFEGKDVEPELTITRKGAPDLIKGVDYTVVYENNDGIGTATAVITGIGSYIGVKRVSFKIIGVSIKNAKLSPIENKVFDGTEQKQNLELYWNNAKLEEGEHYKVTYSNNINSGTAKMVIEGINLYTGTIKKTFKISPYNLKEDELKKVSGLEDDINVIYTKGGCKPTVKLFYGDTELLNGIDYKMSYKNNGKAALATAAKAPTMVIKGKGNYAGTLEKTFTIKPKDFSDLDNPVSIIVADLVVSKSAGKYKSIPSLYDSNGKKLKAGTDYESKVIYRSEDGTELTNKHKATVGEKILVEVTGKGSYFNTITATYEITKKDFRKAKITIKPQEYTGQSIYLNATDIKVSVGKSKLTFGKDYEIVENSYKNNLGKGNASVTIRGIGNFGGTKTVSFKIGARSITDFWKGIYAKMAELWN